MLVSKGDCRYVAVKVLLMVSERYRSIKKKVETIMALFEDKKILTPRSSRIYDKS